MDLLNIRALMLFIFGVYLKFNNFPSDFYGVKNYAGSVMWNYELVINLKHCNVLVVKKKGTGFLELKTII